MLKRKFLQIAFLCNMIILTCGMNSCSQEKGISMEKEQFGKLKDGRVAYLYTLTNPGGASLQVTEYGASVVALKVPDRDGKIDHVVLGYESLDEYVRLRHYFGSTVGRFGNRIDKGKFSLNGTEYQLPINDGENSLHGGLMGFDRVLWQAKEVEVKGHPAVQFTYISEDGEEGYPGTMTTQVTYSFSSDNVLQIDYRITTDKTTVKNVTNHSYFNLSGNAKTPILDHEVMFNAAHFLPADKGLIPTGEIRSVTGTPMDFTKPHTIGERIDSDDEQLVFGQGYDHNWVLNDDSEMNYAGYVYEPVSGRKMDIYTSEPGMQFYSGNFMDGSDVGHEGKVYPYRHAFVLETQHYPDSPNHENFPTTILEPGEVYTSRTILKFSVE